MTRKTPDAGSASGNRPLLIGIAGGTGSGKTTLATKLVAQVPGGHALLLQQDAYYRDLSHLSPAERERINYDEPAAIENERLARDLAALKSGRAVEGPLYDFATHTRKAETRHLAPCAIIVTEGILLFAVEQVRELFDLRIFVDTPDDLRLLRRISRDLTERRWPDIGAIEAQYLSTVRPMHELHVAPTRRHAHLIVPEGGENTQALDVIVGRMLYALGL